MPARQIGKPGGRHASVGANRYVREAVKDFQRTHRSARVCFAHVTPVVRKGARPGTWTFKGAPSAEGGMPLLIFAADFFVEAHAYLGGAAR